MVGPKRGFLIQGDDRVGAIADIVGKLADAKINITAIDAISTDGRYGALCWVARHEEIRGGLGFRLAWALGAFWKWDRKPRFRASFQI